MPSGWGLLLRATEATDAESLRQIGDAFTAYLSPASPFHFANWGEAISVVLGLGADRPVPVVIDGFPYLVKANPELPSVIQQALSPFGHARSATRTRLMLCGSALSVMGRLLSGTAPLRGRAGLELIIPPLDHRLAAQFRGIEDPDRLGGLPAKVGAGVLNDAAGRSAHEVDVVVTGIPDGRTPLLAIGEAKWNELTGIGHLERLRHFKSVIDSRNRYDTSQTRIACFSGAGFTSDLVAAAASAPDVLLISPAELYGLSDEKPPARASSR